MWAEAKPRVRKRDPPSLCLSLSGLVHRLGAGGKGTESGCQDRRSACRSSSVSLTPSRAALSGHPELLRQMGILPQKKGWPH